MESQDLTAQLKDFGFSEDQIRLSLKHSTDKTIDGLVTWITDHENLEPFL
jgi:hypothetical protein